MADTKNDQQKAAENQNPAGNKPQVSEDPKAQDIVLGAGGGAEVTMRTPVLRGVPVVVPLTDALLALGYTDVNLVDGVALGAPVVEGIPEMIANSQGNSLPQPKKKEGDITGMHWVQGQPGNEHQVIITFVGKDGAIEDHTFITTEKIYKGLEKALGEGQSQARSYLKDNFDEKSEVKNA